MNLFICRTIFQAYYARVLIKAKSIKDVMFVYLSEELSDREKNVLSCSGIDYIVIGGSHSYKRLLKQIWLLNYLYRVTKKQSVDFYFSSIDDPFIQTIISRNKFSNIYTFDDGTANYVPNSFFYIEKKKKLSVRIKYYLMGNRIRNLHGVKKLIKTHYSTNHFKNIIDDVEYIPLHSKKNFSDLPVESKKHEVVNIYLCPNFDEVYIDAENVIKKFISTLTKHDIIIPHPRDKLIWGAGENYKIRNDTMAEIVIDEYLSKGCLINLFGIANSTQYHYLQNNKIINHVIDIGKIKPEFEEAILKQIECFKNLTN
ncbi:hypothetical protein CXP54_10900 [Escherichia albertii]|uniref:Glucosyltransferase n=1 Tax=Escherichia albertii TaxID=208962 RepID=A0A1Z1EDU1_ESCAL|nr:glycosyltransferase family 52 [Escherichia albertii]ARO72739.1 glycosyltransferase family 52 [Escherichia albertii]ARO73566.1 glucosyltransferase [Escherichia albertii]ARO73580.1 glucosyltransferase [Escherichia albertii]AUS66060.1 hypothetical protein CXP54_10900 [Escherichia albertii]EAB1454895.1 hypothetical protein [Escherichia albertii]